jgi:hypothetical protein
MIIRCFVPLVPVCAVPLTHVVLCAVLCAMLPCCTVPCRAALLQGQPHQVSQRRQRLHAVLCHHHAQHRWALQAQPADLASPLALLHLRLLNVGGVVVQCCDTACVGSVTCLASIY